ncbi:hypothetical protein EGI31_13355 [Lacihabitans soyangensis]|uniref:Uncharacterized protein n=1 Tax=Lacihabitans soyangensis TaxID=869394 RepID=A0AAE3H4A0_9BACT|nr:hypothetical protein [Lacihabitans soyangensis]
MGPGFESQRDHKAMKNSSLFLFVQNPFSRSSNLPCFCKGKINYLINRNGLNREFIIFSLLTKSQLLKKTLKNTK